MTRSIKLAVSAALALSATSALATNGDNMLALSAKSTGMGGTGISISNGAQSALSNAALVRGNEVTFGGTIFMPSVEFSGQVTQPQPNGAKYQSSNADLNLIPSVAFSQQINDNFSWGLGMFGTAGLGVDYKDDKAMYFNNQGMPAADGNQNMYAGTMNGTNQLATSLLLLKFTLPLAYTTSGFSVGIAPVIQYGALGMSYNNGAFTQGVERDPMTGAPTGNSTYRNVNTGSATSDDLGFGYELGLAYEISGISLGAIYKSAIDMEYKNQISSATQNFGIQGINDHLEQPAEIGLGVSYTLAGNTIALDYKNIKWASAQGYEDFGWEDQNVIAIGYEYQAKGWALRLGYNHANNPVVEQDGAAGFNAQGQIGNYKGAVMNYFNTAGFPAIIEDHYTVGGSFNISEKTSIDLAYVYSPEVSLSYDTSAMSQGQYFNGNPAATPEAPFKSSANVNHSQSALSVAVNIGF